MSGPPAVTVAGGGISGLTAALRLAERGYRVKLYERAGFLGGDLGSRPGADGVGLDVYPHMYGAWYHNFFRLVEEVTGAGRETTFAPFSSVKQLRRGEFPHFATLTDLYSPWHLLQNLFSGAGPVPDMFVFGYSTIDLLAERTCPTMLPDDMTVGGFLSARSYMTGRAEAAVDSFITNVWGVPSYLVSAADYRAYLEYCLAEHDPAFWLARGPGSRQMIDPLEAALVTAGVEITKGVQITSVSCRDGRAQEIGLQETRAGGRSGDRVGGTRRWSEEVDELVLAIPPGPLLEVTRSGRRGGRLVEIDPRLAELSRLRTQPIPMFHVYFTRRLADIPAQPVGLFQSPLALAFTDISQTWHDTTDFGHRTVLALSSSAPFGLPGTSDKDDAMVMLRELAEYLDFDPGARWGDSDDIDWQRSRYAPNLDAQLFLNEVGSEPCRPGTVCRGVVNLSLAGDFCRNRMGMTTIESAVISGLEAARSIVQRHGGAPIEVRLPKRLPGLIYVWLRYAWGPYALGASAWSRGSDVARGVWGAVAQRRDS